MLRRRKKSKMADGIFEHTKANIALGVGTVAVDAAGGSTAGMSAMANTMPAASSTMMAGHVMGMVPRPRAKKKRRRKR